MPDVVPTTDPAPATPAPAAPAAAAPASSTSSTLSILAGAIPVVGGVISSLINNANQNKINQENEQFQLQQQQAQDAYNTEMWNMQNAYNAPAAAMARDLAAGLNPNLIYGNSTGNVAMAPPQMATANYVAKANNPINGAEIADSVIQAYNNTRQTTANANQMAAVATNTLEDTLLKKTQEALNDAGVQKTDAETDLTNQQTAGQLNENNAFGIKTSAYLSNLQAATNLSNAEAKTTDAMREPNLAKSIQEVINMRTDNLKSQADIDQIKQSTQNLINTGKLQNMDITMRQNGVMPSDPAYQRVLGAMATALSGGSANAVQTGSTYKPAPTGKTLNEWESQLPAN